ncbi:MAG: hypothetical protein FWH25_00610 [Syntrophorhabdaceae bacterium]|nr:hypothetical protein [Syntrophorhabdaceae bacterium]
MSNKTANKKAKSPRVSVTAPSKAKAKPAPAIAKAKPVPATVEEKPALVPAETKPAPAIAEAPVPATVEEKPAPVPADAKPTPAIAEATPVPTPAEEKPAPTPVDVKPAPAIDEAKPVPAPAPAIAEAKPVSATVELEPVTARQANLPMEQVNKNRLQARVGRYLPAFIPVNLPDCLQDYLPPLREKSIGLAEKFLRPEGRVRRFLFWFILAPTAAVFIYLSFFASNIYISEAKFAVRSQSPAPSLGIMAFFSRGGGSSAGDAHIVYNYIYSQDMLEKLDARLHIRDHYSSRNHDPWYRLWRNSTQNELIKYWEWAAISAFDPDTGILSIKVKAFTPQMAQEICRGILEYSEDLVNAMNSRARHDAINQARHEVARAEERIVAAHTALKKYQDQTRILDPNAVAGGLYAIVNTLEGEITKTKAELAEALTFLKNDAPRVVTLQNRLSVLEKQLGTEKQRLAGAMKKDQSLSAMISEFQRLALEEEFARTQFTTAMASLETARVQAEAQTLYVESFARPTLPDESLYPRPVLFSFVFMVSALLIMGIVTLIIAADREHAGF